MPTPNEETESNNKKEKLGSWFIQTFVEVMKNYIAEVNGKLLFIYLFVQNSLFVVKEAMKIIESIVEQSWAHAFNSYFRCNFKIQNFLFCHTSDFFFQRNHYHG